MSAQVRAEVEEDVFGLYDPTKYDNPGDTAPTLGAKNGKTLYDLRGKDIDDPAWEPLLDQLSFDDMSLMINLGSWRTAAIESVGKVATSDCDGPAGLSNFMTQSYGTAYPTEVLMAQTWNTALMEEMGTAMGQEYADANSNRFTDQSATALLAMRQSCKNIMYTVVNSGYYANGDAFVPVDYVGSFFLPINIGVGVVLALVEAAAVYLFLKKFKAA